jgi:hypothetical protein
MEKHVTLVAAFKMGMGILGFLGAIVVVVVVPWAGRFTGDPDVMDLLNFIGKIVGVIVMGIALMSLIAGIGLLSRKPWARVLTLLLAVLDLLAIPFGTVLGIYVIWVMLQDDTVALFTPAPEKT